MSALLPKTVSDELGALGVTVRSVQLDGRRALELSTEKVRGLFIPHPCARAPYPSELDRIPEGDGRIPTLITAPYISEPLGLRITHRGWSWADEEGNYDLRSDQLLLRRRFPSKPPHAQVSRLFHPGTSLTIIRWLLAYGNEDEVIRQQPLAQACGVTQGRVSQVLSQLVEEGLLQRKKRSTFLNDRRLLLDAFLAEYPGPGGSERLATTPRSPTVAAQRIVRWAESSLGGAERVRISADVSADLIAPDAQPTRLIVYSQEEPDWDEIGLVEAPNRDVAKVIWRIPKDASLLELEGEVLWVTLQGDRLPLVDGAQQIWDLKDLGGADREQQAERLREWLMHRRRS